MLSRLTVVPLAFLMALLLVCSTAAQRPIRVSVSGAAFSTGLKVEMADETERLSGFTAGGDASISYGRTGFSLRYQEGSVSADGSGDSRGFVEGKAMFSVTTVPWLAISLGPHIRSLIDNGATQRSLFWEGRLGARTHLGDRRITSSIEIWQVLSGDVDGNEAFGSGKGLEGVLKWNPSSVPIWVALGYHIDRSTLGGGSTTEVVEHLMFSIGWGDISPN